jgi:hypothetical protein
LDIPLWPWHRNLTLLFTLRTYQTKQLSQTNNKISYNGESLLFLRGLGIRLERATTVGNLTLIINSFMTIPVTLFIIGRNQRKLCATSLIGIAEPTKSAIVQISSNRALLQAPPTPIFKAHPARISRKHHRPIMGQETTIRQPYPSQISQRRIKTLLLKISNSDLLKRLVTISEYQRSRAMHGIQIKVSPRLYSI